MNNIIEKHYKEYDKLVLPKNAGEVQRKETEQAFYSGAWLLFSIISKIAHGESEEISETKLEEIRQELETKIKSYREIIK